MGLVDTLDRFLDTIFVLNCTSALGFGGLSLGVSINTGRRTGLGAVTALGRFRPRSLYFDCAASRTSA